jgi:hypothetical protein
MKLTQFDYVKGAAYNAVGEDLYEAGMIDNFGFVTPKGQKAIEEYEAEQLQSYGIDTRDN